MKKLLLALVFGLCAVGAASAQRVQQPTTSGVVCRYNASPPTLSDGWFGYAQCDSLGKLIVSGVVGGGGGAGDASAANQTSQITQETAINTVLGTQASSTWDGSSAAALTSIERYNGVKLEAVRALLAGTLTVNLPALAATSTKQSDGSQKTQLVDGSGNVIGATSNALDVNIKSGAAAGLAQDSTTAGQLGVLNMGAVTTAAPTYTTTHTSPLSLTTAGELRTNNAVIGAQADSVCGTATGTCSEIALLKYLNQAMNNAPSFVVNGSAVGVGWTGLTPGTPQTGTIFAGNVDLTSKNGTAYGAMTNFGTTPGAVKVDGVNASLFMGTAIISATNGIYSNLLQGNAVISATNGLFANQLQGNAVLSATNGSFANLLQGNAVLSLTNPIFGSITDGTTKAVVKPASTPAATTDAALAVAPLPSELHLGEIASNQIKVQVAQTVTASAYSAGNALGGLMTVANAARVSGSAGAAGTGGILTGLQLNSKTIQTGVQVDVFIFDANPTGSTCTDKTAFVIATADFDKVVGILTIPSTAANGAGWFGATTTGAVGIPTYFPVTYDLASATSIYACAVVRAAITPAATTDISFKFNMLRN